MLHRIVLSGLLLGALALPAVSQESLGWAPFTEPRYGISVDLPFGLFEPIPNPSGPSQAFREIGGQGQLNLYGGDAAGLSIDAVERQFTQQSAGRQITYHAQGKSWFVLSGYYAAEGAAKPLVFYTKVLVSADGQRFSGFEVSYPESEKPRFDPIVERIEDSFTRPR